jgi:cytochrome P450
MDTASRRPSDTGTAALSEAWCTEHYDHMDPELGRHFEPTLERMRDRCPVAHSDRHGGFWVVSTYDEVLGVLQDWQTFSNAQGVAIPMRLSTPLLPPDELDPPIQRVFKRLINAYLTPAMVAPSEGPTRELVTQLIDGFVETGECEFMAAFAQQFPRLSFFDFVLHAPSDDIARLNEWTKKLTGRLEEGYQDAQAGLAGWIDDFVERRRNEPPRGDIVDAVINADIDGRPITPEEIIGTLQLLIFGGLDTTANALGNIVIRFARQPEIAARLRSQPELIPRSIDEFLRLDAPVVSMARTATRDVELAGERICAGDKVLFSLASANHDGGEFREPEAFDLDRDSNRHLSFGAGPHRCAGSNLARLNLRVALEEITTRLHDIRLQDGAEPIAYDTAFNRSPLAVPITFRPGPKRLA